MKIALIALAMALLTAGCDNRDKAVTGAAGNDPQQKSATALNTATAAGEAVELEWDDLMPNDWEIEDLIEEYNTSDITDDDPRAIKLMEEIQEALKNAPVTEEYDGKQVKIPGFVVPLELDAKNIREFLLVPYFGACIHSPPPPSNQTVHVVADEDRAYQGQLFDTVWVTGTMKIERMSSELGDAGYRIDVTRVEPFE